MSFEMIVIHTILKIEQTFHNEENNLNLMIISISYKKCTTAFPRMKI